MLTIVTLLACSADLSACRKVRLDAYGLSAAQMAVAEWIADGHEGYRVIEWKVGGKR